MCCCRQAVGSGQRQLMSRPARTPLGARPALPTTRLAQACSTTGRACAAMGGRAATRRLRAGCTSARSSLSPGFARESIQSADRCAAWAGLGVRAVAGGMDQLHASPQPPGRGWLSSASSPGSRFDRPPWRGWAARSTRDAGRAGEPGDAAVGRGSARRSRYRSASVERRARSTTDVARAKARRLTRTAAHGTHGPVGDRQSSA